MLVASSRLVCMLIQETPQNCHIRSWELASIVFAEVGSGTVLNWLYGFKKHQVSAEVFLASGSISKENNLIRNVVVEYFFQH